MKLFLMTLVLIGLMGRSAHGKENPRAARSVHLAYDGTPAALAFYNEVTVLESQTGTYFMTCGFNGGYMGIQQRTDGRDPIVIFSIWDSDGENNPNKVPVEKRVEILYQGETVHTERFGGEGSGGKSTFSYPWKVGERYKFMVVLTPEPEKTTFAGYFFLNETKTWKHLATFRVPSKTKSLRGLYSFCEDFRRDGKSVQERHAARFGNGWVQSLQGEWHAITIARFTADGNVHTNIDAGTDDTDFYLATGGKTEMTHPIGAKFQHPDPVTPHPELPPPDSVPNDAAGKK